MSGLESRVKVRVYLDTDDGRFVSDTVFHDDLKNLDPTYIGARLKDMEHNVKTYALNATKDSKPRLQIRAGSFGD